MPENKKTTENPQEKQSLENSNLTLPAGDEVPADREPFRSVRGRLPEMVSGCSAKEPARMPYLHEANLANLNSPLRGEAKEWLPSRNMRPNAKTGLGITKGKCRYSPGHGGLLPLDRRPMQTRRAAGEPPKTTDSNSLR